MNTRRVRRSRWLVRYTLHRLRFTISINYQIINSTIRITLEYWYSFASPPLFLNFYRILYLFIYFLLFCYLCACVTMCNITLYFISTAAFSYSFALRSLIILVTQNIRLLSHAYNHARTRILTKLYRAFLPPRRLRYSLFFFYSASLFFFLLPSALRFVEV